MNIFVLHHNVEQCARLYNDKHVVKILLELAQMLSTACRQNGLNVGYKQTHVWHPCSVWVRTTMNNWWWARKLAYYLNVEYRYRFDKEVDHKSWLVIKRLPQPQLPRLGLTPFAQAMPDQYKRVSAVAAYRCYYAGAKQTYTMRGNTVAHKWTKRPVPVFMQKM